MSNVQKLKQVPAKQAGFFMAKTMNNKLELTGAEAVIKSLLVENVEVIFGYPGGAIMPIYDALYDYKDQIRHILVRHEQGASHAAEGYARLKGKAGVCFATSGPGATNLVTGIADAMMDSVPMVAITGQVAASVLGTDAFQEADVVGITTPITKWNYQVTDPREIPEVIHKAFKIAESGKPGPVLIDITKNAQFEKCEYIPATSTKQYTKQNPKLEESAFQKAADLINVAKKPYILVGHGVLISNAERQVLELAEKADIPMASTLHGLSAVPTTHPLYVGMLGMHGNYAPNKLTNNADVIIAIGMRFDDRVTGRVKDYAPNAKIIHLDIHLSEMNKIIKVDVELCADAKSSLMSLIPKVKKATHPAWRKEFEALHTEEDELIIKKELHGDGEKIKMAEVIRKISEKTKSEAVVVADVGQHQMYAARYSQFAKPNSFITSGGAGTMGFALPASLGAKVAAPERTIVAVIGDGCFQMTIQELGTIAQENLNVKIVILNNNFLGMVRQWQELFFEKRYSFVHLENPDFVQVAKGFHISGEKVEARHNLDEALDRMFAFDGPYMLDVVVEQEENIFPMIPTGASVDEIRLS